VSRAVRRAGLPIWYTEGFNPHPYLSFPLPLPLGHEGLREAMDLRLMEDMPFQEVGMRLNEVLPEGLRVLAVQEPWNKPGDIKAAEYVISMNCDIAQVEAKLKEGNLTAKKMGKKGHRKVEKEIALCPLIVSYGFNEGTLNCVLAAGSEVNLNPALLLGALGVEDASITRVRLLCENGTAWE
jgi:radical SAM-linked protein